jgi:hypothetical protein
MIIFLFSDFAAFGLFGFMLPSVKHIKHGIRPQTEFEFHFESGQVIKV